MNPRRIVAALLVVALLATAVFARSRLERLGEDRISAELLYLPEGPYLRALSFGQEETLADLIYIWAIQYYSSFEDVALRFEYLEKIFEGAITELDPRFLEVYLIGGLVMSLEAREPEMALALYDKGIAAVPDSWELPYWAGWECYNFGDYACARRYWAQASEMPDAPSTLLRLAAYALAKAGDPAAALAEYRRLAEQAPDEKTERVAREWVARLETRLLLERLDRAIAEFRTQRGRCPRVLGELVRAGVIDALPASPAGEPFRYDPAACKAYPPQGQSFEVE